MTTKIALAKPILLCLYGFPGSGKSFVARNLASTLEIALVSADRVRSELFRQPRYDDQENAIVTHLMNYMTEEFLNAGVGVVYDANAVRVAQRHRLRELAKNHRADYLLVWLQIDVESAFTRTQKRDRRTADDKHAEPQTRLTFDKQLSLMQNPKDEDYLVISGKHAFVTQKNAIIDRLYKMGFIPSETVQHNVAKPGLVNLIPNPQLDQVDLSRRSISVE
ncbi:MAG: ATP-binding protein [Candidatus Saccharimonadales bacterium]